MLSGATPRRWGVRMRKGCARSVLPPMAPGGARTRSYRRIDISGTSHCSQSTVSVYSNFISGLESLGMSQQEPGKGPRRLTGATMLCTRLSSYICVLSCRMRLRGRKVTSDVRANSKAHPYKSQEGTAVSAASSIDATPRSIEWGTPGSRCVSGARARASSGATHHPHHPGLAIAGDRETANCHPTFCVLW